MTNVLQPVLELQSQLEAARQKAVETLLKQRQAIDDQLKTLGYKTRGRPRQEAAK
jgi:hypothetical protein